MDKTTPIDPLFVQLFDLKLRKGDLKKIEIVKAAIEDIASNGLENLTFESIGKRLKINRAHVAYYFNEKSDIVTAAIQYITATAQQTTINELKSTVTFEDRVSAYISGAFKWTKEYPSHARVLVTFYQLCCHNPKHRAMHSKIRKMGAERIADIITAEDKKISKPVASKIGRTIQAIITGRLLEFVTTENSEDLQHIETETKDTCLDLISHARSKMRTSK